MRRALSHELSQTSNIGFTLKPPKLFSVLEVAHQKTPPEARPQQQWHAPTSYGGPQIGLEWWPLG